MSANMFSQRALQVSMRRLALTRPTTSSMRMISPLAIATGQIRTAASGPHASTVSVSQEEAVKLLAEQRTHRPVSPHLGIYKAQVTWIPSIMTRLTGAILSGAFYIYGAAYLIAPAMGWHLESASVAAAFAAWPVIAKLSVKALMAYPLVFHTLQGFRHLIWDMGMGLANSTVNSSAWVAIAATAVVGTGLMFY